VKDEVEFSIEEKAIKKVIARLLAWIFQ